MAQTLSCVPACGPAPGLSLAECRAAGCGHLACHRAARAHERLTPPVPGAGTSRRLQALAYNGFSPADLAGRLGVPVRGVLRLQVGRNRDVPAGLAAAVSALYDALWHLTGASPQTAAAARRRNWCPPLGWDDDSPGDDGYTGHGIDDPDAVPALGWQRQLRRLSQDEQAAELVELVTFGLSVNQAAMRLGMSGNALEADPRSRAEGVMTATTLPGRPESARAAREFTAKLPAWLPLGL